MKGDMSVTFGNQSHNHSINTNGYTFTAVTADHALAHFVGCGDCGASIDRNDPEAVLTHTRWHEKLDKLLAIWDTLGAKARAEVRDDLEDLVRELHVGN